MSLPTMEKEKEDFYRRFFETGEPLPPLARMETTGLILESQENSSLKEFGRKIILNSFIIAGGFLLHGSTALLFYNFVLKPHSTLPQPWQQLILFFGGLILLFLETGKVKKKSDLIPYGVFPLMGITCSMFFNFWLKDLPLAEPFFLSGIISFLLALAGFYYAKKYFAPSDDEPPLL